MKKLFTLIVIFSTLLQTSANARREYSLDERPDSIIIYLASPTEAKLTLTPKVEFPNVKRSYSIRLDCKRQVFDDWYLGGDTEDWKNRFPDSIKDLVLSTGDFSVGCADSFLFVKSSSLDKTLSAISGLIDAKYEKNILELLRFDGYVYPNIKAGYYREYLTIDFENSNLRAYDGENNRLDFSQKSIVGVLKGNTLTPVMFADKQSPQKFDRQKPLELLYTFGFAGDKSAWFKISIDAPNGLISWQEAPSPVAKP